MEYTKCLVELDEILNYLSVENLEKSKTRKYITPKFTQRKGKKYK